MCAIFGWNGKITERLARQLFVRSEDYGPHSTGYAVVDSENDNQTSMFKRAIPAHLFVRNHDRRVAGLSCFKVGFGHVRYATHGAVIDENAHPFEYNGITFCHNGVIGNYASVARDNGIKIPVVDSQCLGPLIEKRRLIDASGSVAAVWIQNGKLYCYRNNQVLGAYVCEVNGESTVILTSRQDTIRGCVSTNPEIKLKSEITLVEGVCYEVTNTGLTDVWSNKVAGSTERLLNHSPFRYGSNEDDEDGSDEDVDAESCCEEVDADRSTQYMAIESNLEVTWFDSVEEIVEHLINNTTTLLATYEVTLIDNHVVGSKKLTEDDSGQTKFYDNHILSLFQAEMDGTNKPS